MPFASNNITKKVGDHHRMEENICKSYKGLVVRIHKELLQLNNTKRQITQFKNGKG